MRIKVKELAFILLMLTLVALAFSISLTQNKVEYRARGPLPILINVFLLPFILVTLPSMLIIALPKVNHNIKLTVLFMIYNFKLLMPYIVFDWHINYDTPSHYLSSLYLSDIGYSERYIYHNWPSALILASIVNEIANIKYPFDCSFIAIVTRMLIPPIVYIIGKNVLELSNKSLYSGLIALATFEPFIIHFCPQIVAVSLVMCSFTILLKLTLAKSTSDIITFFVFFVALLFTHAMFPISILIYVIILWMLKIIKSFYIDQTHEHDSQIGKVIMSLPLPILALVAVYNIFITMFVTKNILETVRLFISGDIIRLDVYEPIIDDIQLEFQYTTIRLASLTATIILLGIPALYASTKFAHYLFKRKGLDKKNFLFMQIVSHAGLYFLLYTIFEMGLRTGLVERYYQIAIITATILSGMFYGGLTLKCNVSNLTETSKMFSLFLLIMSISLVASIVFTPSYVTLFLWPYTPDELTTARFVSNYEPHCAIKFTGDKRLAQQIELELYLRKHCTDISYNNLMDINCLHQSYSYLLDTLIPVNRLTIFKPTNLPGLTINILKNYIENMYNYLNRIYDNFYNFLYTVN